MSKCTFSRTLNPIIVLFSARQSAIITSQRELEAVSATVQRSIGIYNLTWSVFEVQDFSLILSDILVIAASVRHHSSLSVTQVSGSGLDAPSRPAAARTAHVPIDPDAAFHGCRLLCCCNDKSNKKASHTHYALRYLSLVSHSNACER